MNFIVLLYNSWGCLYIEVFSKNLISAGYIYKGNFEFLSYPRVRQCHKTEKCLQWGIRCNTALIDQLDIFISLNILEESKNSLNVGFSSLY